jgi:hypothetical protein
MKWNENTIKWKKINKIKMKRICRIFYKNENKNKKKQKQKQKWKWKWK